MAERRPVYWDFATGEIKEIQDTDSLPPALGGGGSFTDLSDTPSSYASQGGKYVRVNTGESALEFVNPPAGSGDVTGPASSANNNIALFDGVTGKAIKDSGVALSSKADATHSHAISDVTGLQTALDGKAATSHTHAAGDITSGTMATARLGSGTADSTTFLRGDSTWQSVSAGATDLDGLSDVVLSDPASGKYLRHNGTNWADAEIPDGDLGSGTANNTTFLRGDRTWATAEDGRIVALGSNVTHNNTGTYNQIFTIALDASSSHFIQVNMIAETDTAGVACQVRARVTESGTTGYVLFRTPTTATAAPFDQIALGTNPSDTGETAIIAANIPIPIVAYVALKTGATPGSLVIEFQPEVAGTITIRKGSNYIKT